MLQTQVDMCTRLDAIENWDWDNEEPDDEQAQEFAGEQAQEFAGHYPQECAGNWQQGPTISGMAGAPRRETSVGDIFDLHRATAPTEIPGMPERRSLISPGPWGTASQGKGNRGVDEGHSRG